MKLEIDTQRDSPQELRAAIALLQTMLGEKPHHHTIEPVPEAKQEQMMSMFDMGSTDTVPSAAPSIVQSVPKEEPKFHIIPY